MVVNMNTNSTLTNVKVSSIVVELDRKRNLTYNMNSFAALEEKFGTVEAAMAALDGKSIKAFRTFLWAGLVHEDETLTELQVGSMLDMSNMQLLVEKMSSMLITSLPDADGEKKGE